MKSILRFTLLLTCLLVIVVTNLKAATFTVTNTLDAGTNSLRWAITQANASPLGPHSITFNIPNTDPHYDAGTGVYTITVNTLLPTVNAANVTIDGTTQPANTNPFGPEIGLTCNPLNLTYGICFPLSGGIIKGMIINGFQVGVLITVNGIMTSGNCTVSDCYIGVNFNGTVAVPNNIGIGCYGLVTNNTIMNNLISGNTTAGIGIRKSNSNVIKNNKIGTNRTGMSRIPNYYGVAIDSAASNTVGGTTAGDRNLISGNSYAGVAINTNVSHNNVVKGNYIGTNINAAVRSDTIKNFYGIAIQDSYSNSIGGPAAGERNIISGNSESGIAILGATAKSTVIKGNYIGTNAGGNDSIPNGNGILLSGASNTVIGGSALGERNIISGNKLAGIAMAYSGTRNNTIKGNYIGTDYLGTHILSNYAGVYIKSNSNSNIIGGSAPGERNIISGNLEMGLCVEAADSNVVKGNYIGPDVTGVAALKLGNDSLVQANGLYFNSNAKHNIAGGYNAGEGNVISGNRVYGHDLYGNSSYNSTIGNYIGVDATGNVAMPNATGICVDGGSNHNPFINNVLSGNKAYGMFIVTTGTDYNEVKGNKIGTNAAGTDTVPNQSGLLLGGGAKYNSIGGTAVADRNIISGNRFDGILVADAGTDHNNITGNYIGTDGSGSTAFPNQIGVGLATNPSYNNIENNVISGNSSVGLVIFEGCFFNTVYTNKIGVAANGTSPLNNNSIGIHISAASQHNEIGGPGKGNIIANHVNGGIVVVDSGTWYNRISECLVYNNGFMDIDLFPYGPDVNDPGDGDTGPNFGMNYPVINTVYLDYVAQQTTISGTISNSSPVGIKIEIFKSNGANTYGHGGSIAYIGSVVISDPGGNWTYTCGSYCLSPGDLITATATDPAGNTSEFATNVGLVVGMQKNSTDNFNCSIYPNPVADKLSLSFTTKETQHVKVILSSVIGKQIAVLEDREVGSGVHRLEYDLSHYNFTNGIYFLNFIIDGDKVQTRKLIVSK